MNKQTIVTINGTSYDSVTGMPVTTSPQSGSTANAKPTIPATALHARLQRSNTLNRKAIKKPISNKPVSILRAPGRTMDIARSPAVAKFAPHPRPAMPAPAKSQSADIAVAAHPALTRALMKQSTHSLAKVEKPTLSAKDQKNAVVSQALTNATKPTDKKRPMAKRNRTLTIVGVVVIAVVLIGYILYLNMPILSVKVASAQAGIDATYPSYTPSGYSLSGPVSYQNGEVDINFGAATGSTKFTIKQTKSSWDSSAVLDSVVKPQVDNNYLTTEQNGLTIYTYQNDAAWVNGGILYTIDGTAPLSTDQIGNIATSMQ